MSKCEIVTILQHRITFKFVLGAPVEWTPFYNPTLQPFFPTLPPTHTLISISNSMMAAMMVRTAALVLWGRNSHDWNGMLMWASWSKHIVPNWLSENLNVRLSIKEKQRMSENAEYIYVYNADYQSQKRRTNSVSTRRDS